MVLIVLLRMVVVVATASSKAIWVVRFHFRAAKARRKRVIGRIVLFFFGLGDMTAIPFIINPGRVGSRPNDQNTPFTAIASQKS